MLTRRGRETQRQFVERVLREEGRIATYDALYNAQWEDGRKTSVTRLAAIIHTLRGSGWTIDTEDTGGRVAVYVLRATPGAILRMPPPVQRPTWRCLNCAGKPAHEPAPLLGGMGEAYCAGCRRRTAFRSAA